MNVISWVLVGRGGVKSTEDDGGVPISSGRVILRFMGSLNLGEMVKVVTMSYIYYSNGLKIPPHTVHNILNTISMTSELRNK